MQDCKKCGNEQKANEKKCKKCGTSFGGDLNTIYQGVGLLLGLPIIILLFGSPEDFYSVITNKAVVIGYFLPVICGTAILYDYNSKRGTFYLYGLVIIVGLWLIGYI